MTYRAMCLILPMVLDSLVELGEAATYTASGIWLQYDVALPRFDDLEGTRILKEATVDVELGGLTYFAYQTPGVPHTHNINVNSGPLTITGITSEETVAGSHRHAWSATSSYTFTGSELDLFLDGPTILPISSEFSSSSSFPGHLHAHRLPGTGFQSRTTTTFTFSVIPEPSTLCLLGVAFFGILLLRIPCFGWMHPRKCVTG